MKQASSNRLRVDALKTLQEIPGVGPSIAQDLWDLGIRRVTDLRHRDPERLYRRLCGIRQAGIDRCMLYVLRCAVYYASHVKHDPERLLWWNWKDPRDRGNDGNRRGGVDSD